MKEYGTVYVKELSIEVSTGVSASDNMDGVKSMTVIDESNVTWSDLQKLNSLRRLHFKSCKNLFIKLDDTVVLHSVQNLHLEELSIDGELFFMVLRCFPALSHLTITMCKNLELLPVEDRGLWGLKLLQSFTAYHCGNLFTWWHMGEAGGGAGGIKPFPSSLTEVDICSEASMKSMGLLSNLTSLITLSVVSCEELTMDGFNPLMTVNLKKLVINTRYCNQNISIAGDLLSEIVRSKVMQVDSCQLEELWVDSISAVLTAPICSHLGTTLHRLVFNYDQRTATFTEKQQEALQLLTSLHYLEFDSCHNLRSLPKGLRGLSSLKRLEIVLCRKILSLPPKEDLPTSLEELQLMFCSPQATEQAEKIKGEDPWFSVLVRAVSRRKDVSMSSRMLQWIRG